MSPKKGPKLKKKVSPKGAPAAEPPYLNELKALIELVTETGVSELEVQSAGRVFKIGRGNRTYHTEAAPIQAAAPAAAKPAASGPPAAESSYVAVKSPIVGTFYRAPAPDADSYIEEGQRVAIGQTVCIIEAMKLMNEIQSEVSGRIVRILVQNAQPVEYGQELFLVDPGS
jgi:acetyl-CoA carboxylase biotin carboxyl carrier protein